MRGHYKHEENTAEIATVEQFSSHVMRHTGCTNMARAGINVKATQYVMGHAHSDVTMDVYNQLNNKTDVKLEFSKFEKKVQKWYSRCKNKISQKVHKPCNP